MDEWFGDFTEQWMLVDTPAVRAKMSELLQGPGTWTSPQLYEAHGRAVRFTPRGVLRRLFYVSLVSCEISLKYVLAKAGVPVPKNHNVAGLIDLISKCTVETEIPIGCIRRVSASRIRSVVVDEGYNNATLGKSARGRKCWCIKISK